MLLSVCAIIQFMKVIDVRHLTFGYSQNYENIKDLSFQIEEGQYVSIIGHNGSGKSTLARLLMGLLTAKSGDIYFYDELLSHKTVHNIRKKVGIVFQNPDNQFIASTVEDDIAFGLENKCITLDQMKKDVSYFATKVGMKDFLTKEPTMLSGGQKQRVAIAGVLAMRPSIIILDEATSMLDPKGRKEIRDLILEMKKENPSLTILSITHDVQEAYQSDYVLVLHNGRMVLKGTPSEVFSQKEVIKKVGLFNPLIVELKEKFTSAGFDVGDSKNIEELVEKICQ